MLYIYIDFMIFLQMYCILRDIFSGKVMEYFLNSKQNVII